MAQCTIDIVSLPINNHTSEPTTFAKHIHDTHIDIRQSTTMSTEKYILVVDAYRRNIEFNESDYMMVYIHLERYLDIHKKELRHIDLDL